MIGRIADFILGSTKWGQAAAWFILAAVLFGFYQYKLWDARALGRAQKEKEVRHATAKVVERSDRVRAGVNDQRVRGVVDPNYID